MPSAFAQMYAIAQGAADVTYGETVQFCPQGAGKYVKAGTDPTRRIVDVVGIFSGDPALARRAGAGVNSKDNAEINTDRFVIDFDVSQFPDGPPRDGDVIVRTEEPGAPEYKVVSPSSDNLARIICPLIERGTP